MRIYYYIKHGDDGPIRVVFSGIKTAGYLDGEASGFNFGIHDVTHFPDKESAKKALTLLRFMKSKKESKKFRMVKVTVT